MQRWARRSEVGLTRLESSIVTSVVIAGLLVGAGLLVRTTASESGEAGIPIALPAVVDTQDDAPVTVNVVAPGTIAQSPPTQAGATKDTCPDLRGAQPAGFDCALPLYAPALDLSAVRIKGRYQCADPENYRLVKGQTVQRDKKCVLKTAKTGRS